MIHALVVRILACFAPVVHAMVVHVLSAAAAFLTHAPLWARFV